MRLRLRHRIVLAAAVSAAVVGCLPANAVAGHGPKTVDALATISGCRGESLTIAVDIRALKKVRRATLQLRFEAAPLYGAIRRSRKFDLGRTKAARRSLRFSELPAQSYGGVVHYKWVRGKRTVMSGFVRTRRGRVNGRRGKAFCSLRVGKKPVDTTPPVIVPLPADSGWKRGPLDVTFFVYDDLSGVALVVSRVDGGPFARGRATRISGEGTHTLEYAARDAAGNQTRLLAVTLRVDQGAPTTPAISAPTGSTTDPTPEIRWGGSSDTASGVAGYVVLVRNSAGAIVWSQNVGAAVRAVTVAQSLGVGNYTAEVIAYDGAAPQPFTTTDTSAFTVVAPPPNEPPADGDNDGVPDASDNCPAHSNPNQEDESDNDGQGEVCDTDDDNDGLSDSAETGTHNTDPKDPDSDGDTLSDGAEVNGSPATNPNNPDTDGDDEDDGNWDDAHDPCPTQAESDLDLTPDGCP